MHRSGWIILLLGCLLCTGSVYGASVLDGKSIAPGITVPVGIHATTGADLSVVGNANPMVKGPSIVTQNGVKSSISAPTASQYFTYWDQFGSYGTAESQFNNPIGIAIDRLGYFFVADSNNHRIQKFKSNYRLVKSWGKQGTKNATFNSPQGIAIDSQGNVYVADTYNNRVQKFNANGTFITAWGGSGNLDGQFSSPNSIAITKGDIVYVVDGGNNRIQRFTTSGKYLGKWGAYGAGSMGLSNPQGIAFDSAGNVYVADSGNNRIVKYNYKGDFLAKWVDTYDSDEQTWSLGFGNPTGIAVDSSNNMYVCGSTHQTVLLSSTGTVRGTIGKYGSGNGEFTYPQRIVLDSSGSFAYITENYPNSRVQIFKLSAVGNPAPVVSSISPTKASPGQVVYTITGSNFVTGLTVSFVHAPCANLTNTVATVTSTAITGTVTVPPTPCSKSWNVIVTNPDKQKSDGSAIFTINTGNKPAISAIYPTQAKRNNLIPFLLAGSNLKGTGQTVSLTLKGAQTIKATNVTPIIATQQIFGTFLVPATAKTGSYRVTLKQGSTTSTDAISMKVTA